MKEKVIVVGDDGINSLGVIRSLGETGYEVNAVITEENIKNVKLRKSRYIESCIAVEKEEKSLVNALVNFNTENDKYYLIPTSDFVLKVISDNFEALNNKYFLPSVDESCGTLADVMSKTEMAKYAEKAGFIVPKMQKYSISENFKSDNMLFGYFADCYPLILKSDSIFEPGCDFFVVKSRKELEEKMSENIGKTIIIQQYVENAKEIAVQGIGFGKNRKSCVFGKIEKIRTSLFAMGTTTYADLCLIDDSGFKKKACVFSELIGYCGIYDLDILEKDHNYYFIECNFRNGSNGYAYKRFGANLPLIWIKGMQSDEFEPMSLCNLHNITFINDIGDFAHVLNGDVNLIKWLKQYLGADARLTYNFKDQKPFWAEADFKRLFHKLCK